MTLTILIRKANEKTLQREGVVQLDLCGDLQIGPGAAALSKTFEVLIGKFDHIVVNMANVRRLDARGIGCLVQAYAEGCAKGTRVSLCDLPPLISEILFIVKLLAVFGNGEAEFLRAA
jgi:anti-anti-sigma factor